MKEGKVGPVVLKHPITSEPKLESCLEVVNLATPTQIIPPKYCQQETLNPLLWKTEGGKIKETHPKNVDSANYSPTKKVLWSSKRWSIFPLEQGTQLGINMLEEIFNCFDGAAAGIINYFKHLSVGCVCRIVKPALVVVFGATKNHHQGGLNDSTDASDGKMFELIYNSSCCTIKTNGNFLKHVNPQLGSLFQRPRKLSANFNPEKESFFYCNSPVGESTLANMMKTMGTVAGISLYLTNHCVRQNFAKVAKILRLSQKYSKTNSTKL